MNDIYIKLARTAIEEFIKTGKIIPVPKNIPKELTKKRAGVFVSIHKKHHLPGEEDLRGCIGTILPTKASIAQEIIDNAICACSEDYRFAPISSDELDNLEISVDELSEPEPIEGLSNLDPKKYGVVVKSSDGRTGLLLPDIEGIDSPEYQIGIARQKAGINPHEPVYLYQFTVERHKESAV